MQLLVDNKELTDKGHELVMETLKFHQFIETHARNLLKNLTSEKALTDAILNKEMNFAEAPKQMQQIMLERATNLETEKKEIVDDFLAKKVDLFKKPMAVRHQFENLAKKHLKS